MRDQVTSIEDTCKELQTDEQSLVVEIEDAKKENMEQREVLECKNKLIGQLKDENSCKSLEIINLTFTEESLKKSRRKNSILHRLTKFFLKRVSSYSRAFSH